MSEVMAQTTRWGNLSTKLDGYVGFDTVQEQIRKKSLKRGFEFNLMVVGECIPVWHPLTLHHIVETTATWQLSLVHCRDAYTVQLLAVSFLYHVLLT